MKEFRRALVVGKFSPLHRGHELLIRAALARAEHVLLISYSQPELPGCDARRRASWLEALFPECQRLVLDPMREVVPPNDASDSVQRQFVATLCSDRLGTSVDAVFTSEAYGDGFAHELTHSFRQRDPLHPEVRHVCVDQARMTIPVSGSRVREDVHAMRTWLAPVVYASFVKRICILGGESSGKTSLAQALAKATDSEWVPEYGRELWLSRSGRLELPDMLDIARRQIELEEDAVLRARRFLFCDTSPLTTRFYSAELFGRVDAELELLAMREYDHYVLCAPDFPFVQDGTRQDDELRQRQHRYYQQALASATRSYLWARGGLAERTRRLLEVLGLAAV